MNVWELVTDASTLPIDPANTFWDHLNNLGAGGSSIVNFASLEFSLADPIEVEILEPFDVEVLQDQVDVALEEPIDVEFD